MFLKQSFCFFLVPETYFYIIYAPFSLHTKAFNLDDITYKNREDHNKNWPYIPHHPYRLLIMGIVMDQGKQMHYLI